jgi:hypothetical protein
VVRIRSTDGRGERPDLTPVTYCRLLPVALGLPPAARVAAASALLDRGWGKASQSHVGEDRVNLRISIRRIMADEKRVSQRYALPPAQGRS